MTEGKDQVPLTWGQKQFERFLANQSLLYSVFCFSTILAYGARVPGSPAHPVAVNHIALRHGNGNSPLLDCCRKPVRYIVARAAFCHSTFSDPRSRSRLGLLGTQLDIGLRRLPALANRATTNQTCRNGVCTGNLPRNRTARIRTPCRLGRSRGWTDSSLYSLTIPWTNYPGSLGAHHCHPGPCRFCQRIFLWLYKFRYPGSVVLTRRAKSGS